MDDLPVICVQGWNAESYVLAGILIGCVWSFIGDMIFRITDYFTEKKRGKNV